MRSIISIQGYCGWEYVRKPRNRQAGVKAFGYAKVYSFDLTKRLPELVREFIQSLDQCLI